MCVCVCGLPAACLAEDLSLVLYVLGGTRVQVLQCDTVQGEGEESEVCVCVCVR